MLPKPLLEEEMCKVAWYMVPDTFVNISYTGKNMICFVAALVTFNKILRAAWFLKMEMFATPWNPMVAGQFRTAGLQAATWHSKSELRYGSLQVNVSTVFVKEEDAAAGLNVAAKSPTFDNVMVILDV